MVLEEKGRRRGKLEPQTAPGTVSRQAWLARRLCVHRRALCEQIKRDINGVIFYQREREREGGKVYQVEKPLDECLRRDGR